VPGDRGVGNCLLVLAALAESDSWIRGIAPSRHRDLMVALRELGVGISEVDDGVRVSGVGLRGLRSPGGALSAEHPSTLALLTALLAPQHFGTRVTASGAAAGTSADGFVAALRSRGGQVGGTDSGEGGLVAPIAVAPQLEGETLSSAEVSIPMGDAQAKSAMLLSGLYVPGITAISEGMLSEDHMERALLAAGVPLQTMGSMAMLDLAAGPVSWPGFEWDVPADPALVAPLAAAAALTEGSEVIFEHVMLNPTRRGFTDLLRQSGADIAIASRGDTEGGEPWGSLRIRSRSTRSMKVGGELTLRMLGEVPALCALAAGASGRVSIRDIPERGMGEVRRLAPVLRALGLECTDYEDGIDVDPGRSVAGQGPHDCGDDATSALCAVALALSGEVAQTLRHTASLSALYPGVVETLQGLGAMISLENVEKLEKVEKHDG